MSNYGANYEMREIEANKPSVNNGMVAGLSPLSETLWRDNSVITS